MKTRTIPLLFVLITVILAASFFLIRFFISGNVNSEKDSLTRAKIVDLSSAQKVESDKENKLSSSQMENYETFVPLLANETLISTSTFDFTNDGYDDEVIVVRKSGSEILWLIPAIYNSENGEYTRMEQIATPFSRTRTFSYGGIDLIGDHTQALVYQGVDDDGQYVLQAFLCREYSDGNLFFESIGDFSSDGTVFIQQTERSDSYELGISKGESYSIWVYKSDAPEGMTAEEKSVANLNQIQQEYKWNAETGHYELSDEIKLTARRLAAKELSRIQDGTIETFASFLNGLWYRTSNDGSEISYLFFDYDNSELIQFVGDSQEVYEWEDSKLRHNGIYLTTVNADIINLHRRFDIMLVNVDEIKVTVRDEINMNIKQTSEWDGNYKKMNIQSSFTTKETEKKRTDLFLQELSKNVVWISTDDSLTMSFKEREYILQNNEITETGVFSLLDIGNYAVIQFRSDSDFSYLEPSYSMKFGTKVVTETVKRKTVEKTVTDYDMITFSPVKYTPLDCFSADGRVLVMEKHQKQ